MTNKVHGSRSVIAALLGNVIVTFMKTIMAIFSGSASMFAESVHSFADTLNQSLLLVGLKRSKKPADASIFFVRISLTPAGSSSIFKYSGYNIVLITT